MCTPPHSPSPSPQEQLLLAISLFAHIPPTGTVRESLGNVRALLLRVCEGSASPNAYALAISTLNYAENDLDAFEASGDVADLERVKDKVQAVAGLIP